jgi:hypothetical protein
MELAAILEVVGIALTLAALVAVLYFGSRRRPANLLPAANTPLALDDLPNSSTNAPTGQNRLSDYLNKLSTGTQVVIQNLLRSVSPGEIRREALRAQSSSDELVFPLFRQTLRCQHLFI